jgi:hypothetical protein
MRGCSAERYSSVLVRQPLILHILSRHFMESRGRAPQQHDTGDMHLHEPTTIQQSSLDRAWSDFG